MHAAHFIQDLAVIMLIAGIITVIFNRLRQPVVLGYILAGVIIGPHTPPFPLITDEKTINTLAELGIVFLLFALGLEFNLRKLKHVGIAALIAAVAEIILMIWLGYEIGRAFGWVHMDALFLGAILSISSTTIIVKALDELKLKHETFAQLIFGILIVEDILAIAIIALLSSLALSGDMGIIEVAGTLGQLGIFMVIALVFGLLLVPRLLTYVARFQSDEMLLIATLGLCFGFCLLVIKLDYSIALGAFIMGAIIAESRQLQKIAQLITPLRDMFSAIFFVTIGLLLDPQILLEYSLPIFVITLAVVIGKIISCSAGAFIAGNNGPTSLRVGMGLAQIGEFSFIIATLGISLQVTSAFLYPIAVAVSAITTLLTPYLINASEPLAHGLARAIPTRLREFLKLYPEWLQSLQPKGDRALLTRFITRILAHVSVNLIIVTGMFLSVAYFATPLAQWSGLAAMQIRYQRAILWGITLLLTLPFLIAAYRKLKALAMLLAEMSVKESASEKQTATVRQLLSQLIPSAAMGLFLLILAALSASILPPLDLLIAMASIVAIVGLILGPRLIRFHSRLQIALLEGVKTDEENQTTNNHSSR